MQKKKAFRPGHVILVGATKFPQIRAQKCSPPAYCYSMQQTLTMAVRNWIKTNPRVEGITRPLFKKLTQSRWLRTQRRLRLAARYYTPNLKAMRSWALLRTEEDNFYYDLTAQNQRDLVSLVSVVTGLAPMEIEAFADELLSDTQLRQHIQTSWTGNSLMRDSRIGYGRRLGWYLFVRALKPRLVVETGVHHGVGACIIASALARNLEEGHEGRYVGTDIDPGAGILWTGNYCRFGEILLGDSIESLSRLAGPVDIFINDSDHSEEYEKSEYEVIQDRLALNSLILGDNSHVSGQLRWFSWQRSRPYVFFKEAPEQHWYPGAGIGISPARIPLLRSRKLGR